MQSLRADRRVLRRAAPTIAVDGGAARRSCADQPRARTVPVRASQAGHRRRSDTWVPLGLIPLVVIPVGAGTLRRVPTGNRPDPGQLSLRAAAGQAVRRALLLYGTTALVACFARLPLRLGSWELPH